MQVPFGQKKKSAAIASRFAVEIMKPGKWLK